MSICCKESSAQVRANSSKPVEYQDKGDSMERGAYLVFDSASNGSLFMHWKSTKVPGALLFIKPNKKVPDFKFVNNGGRVELLRNLQADKKLFFAGVGQFIKEAKDLEAEICMLPDIDSTSPIKIDLYILGNNNTVNAAKIGVPFSIKNAMAVSVMPRGSTSLLVKTIEKNAFMLKGNSEGACIVF